MSAISFLTDSDLKESSKRHVLITRSFNILIHSFNDQVQIKLSVPDFFCMASRGMVKTQKWLKIV